MASNLFSSARGLAFSHRRRLIGALLRLSTTTADAEAVETRNPSSPNPHFMVEYLITSCGLSSAEASKASKPLSHLKSTQNPDSVVDFMKIQGFDETQLRKIIYYHPKLLCTNVEKTLAPKFRALRDLRFLGSDVIHLVFSHPGFLTLNLRTALPRIEFWRGLVGSTEALVRLFKNKTRFMSSSIEKKAMPNLSLLRERGISDQKLFPVVRTIPTLLLRDPEVFKEMVERVEELGVPCCSGTFVWGLWVVHKVSKARFNANRELMGKFGWSESEFLSAFCKAPTFLAISQKTLMSKMDFLLKEAGLKPSDVAGTPQLLIYSLERRLIPRHRVIHIIKSRGLLKRENKLITLMQASEEEFMKKYVLPHKEKVPQIQEMYSKMLLA